MELNKNISNLRKAKGFSQESLAEKIKVSRQTISNWELGETSPNPEQLLLLSKILEISVDELLGNEMKFKGNNENSNAIHFSISLGSILICGSISGIWAFTANRFTYSEMNLILIGGVVIGYGVSLLINGILKKRK